MQLTLGKTVEYPQKYDPSVLFPIARNVSRSKIGIASPPPFDGDDVWNAYEVSWIDKRTNLPKVGIATISYPSDSEFLVESKSLKLYLGSFFNEAFSSRRSLGETVATDLGKLVRAPVEVTVHRLDELDHFAVSPPPGISIDQSEEAASSSPKASIRTLSSIARETVYSDLLRSLCPVTGQPDWGTLIVSYDGQAIDHASLAGYLLAHRNYQGFHEECCEKIFMELFNCLSPSELCVVCCYTRRGGIDINPMRWIRGTKPLIGYRRLIRQ